MYNATALKKDEMNTGNALLAQLFRKEFSRMVAVISKQFGLQYIETAEDIVSETFLQAAETWETKGIPPNPAAWLYVVAKQKTLYHFRRNKILEQKVIPALSSGMDKDQEMKEPDFSQQNIKDSQLQMIFAICTPAIASEAQIGLALRILCGFGIDEIAGAFLSNKETINKRLFRAKEKLRTEKVNMDLPPEKELPARLDNVLHVIYLLFSEGYYSTTQNEMIRKGLCLEALRLGLTLTEYERTNLPKTNALLALMCFHASRFNARQTMNDITVLYNEQDETLWDTALISQGIHFLDLSMQGNEITSYHLEAQIAYRHCIKEDTPEKWEAILQLYNQLLTIKYAPAIALNRTYALYKANGREAAIPEAEKLKLESSHFYFILLGELYKTVDDDKAKFYYQKAYMLAKTGAEKQHIRQKINSIG